MTEQLHFWIESIENDGVTLTNGEYSIDFEVVAPGDGSSDLPEIFRTATIQDQFDVTIETDNE